MIAQKIPVWEVVWKITKLLIGVVALELMICSGIFQSAKKGDWFWVWAGVFELQLFAAYLGWMLIEDFNTYQRRRRLAQKST